jgi:uncharacterized membrane protein YeaQ/YmgE (transglycosylase-associated protein family)
MKARPTARKRRRHRASFAEKRAASDQAILGARNTRPAAEENGRHFADVHHELLPMSCAIEGSRQLVGIRGLSLNASRRGTCATRDCFGVNPDRRFHPMSIIWTIIIGFIAGVIAKFITPGDNEPSGFILTTILGIIGAFVATYLGQAIGWYRAGEGAGLIGAVVGAVIVLVIWGLIAGRRRTA